MTGTDRQIDIVRVARTRADCVLRPGEAFLGGGTFLRSGPVPAGVTGLVDLKGMGWEPWSVDGTGVRVGGMCTLEELATGPGALAAPSDPAQGSPMAPSGPYRALGIVHPWVSAVSLPPEVARAATVGGNLALGLPLGSVAGLFEVLHAHALLWTPDGGSREVAVADLVAGAGDVDLAPGELLREVRVPAHVLEERTALRCASLTSVGPPPVMVAGRTGTHAPKVTITASVPAPQSIWVRDHGMLDRWMDSLDRDGIWFEDTHGTRAWRAATTRRLAHEVFAELSGVSSFVLTCGGRASDGGTIKR